MKAERRRSRARVATVIPPDGACRALGASLEAMPEVDGLRRHGEDLDERGALWSYCDADATVHGAVIRATVAPRHPPVDGARPVELGVTILYTSR